MSIRRDQYGVSLVELILFIVIVGVALAGILTVLNVNTARSADPLISKQSLAIAESLIEEIELMPFSFCDPNDSNAEFATAANVANCPAAGGAGGVENPGPEAGETRYADPQFDNVNDYHNFTMSVVIRDIIGNDLQLDGYAASVSVAAADLGGIAQATGDALLITVTVTGPDNQPITLQGYRTRYAPNVLP